MGQKGAKYNPEVAQTVDLLLERLSEIKGITAKKMFGGQGIFHEGKMFGMVDTKGKIAFKVDDQLEKEYLKMGSSKHGKMPYYSIPYHILNSEDLIDWAKKSIGVAKE